MNNRIGMVCAVWLGVGTVGSLADVLVNWNLDGLSRDGIPATASTPIKVHDAVTASDLTFSPNLRVTAWSDALAVMANDLSGDLAGAIERKAYFTFTVVPKEGRTIHVDRIFNRVTINTGNLSTGASIRFVLMSSAGGFEVGRELGSFEATHPTDNAQATPTTGKFDLRGVETLQHVGKPVEFRIYTVLVNGVGNRMAYGHIFFKDGQDDLRVEGAVSE